MCTAESRSQSGRILCKSGLTELVILESIVKCSGIPCEHNTATAPSLYPTSSFSSRAQSFTAAWQPCDPQDVFFLSLCCLSERFQSLHFYDLSQAISLQFSWCRLESAESADECHDAATTRVKLRWLSRALDSWRPQWKVFAWLFVGYRISHMFLVFLTLSRFSLQEHSKAALSLRSKMLSRLITHQVLEWTAGLSSKKDPSTLISLHFSGLNFKFRYQRRILKIKIWWSNT